MICHFSNKLSELVYGFTEIVLVTGLYYRIIPPYNLQQILCIVQAKIFVHYVLIYDSNLSTIPNSTDAFPQEFFSLLPKRLNLP